MPGSEDGKSDQKPLVLNWTAHSLEEAVQERADAGQWENPSRKILTGRDAHFLCVVSHQCFISPWLSFACGSVLMSPC
jgi:hypothetical protein